MANEKLLDLIDRNAFWEHWNKEYRHQYANDMFKVAIANFPTVEAVEVIRCRDCKYFSRDEENNRAWCNYYTGCIETAVNGYCYHGKKMDGGNEDGSCNSF